MPPASDLDPAAIDAQLLAGWAFMAGMVVLFVAALVAALVIGAAERFKMQNRKPVTQTVVDRTSYLANLIHLILSDSSARPPYVTHNDADASWAAYTLGGGAQLWHDGATRRLAIMRPNAMLQKGEANVMANHIAKAGYTVEAAGVRLYVDEFINSYHGVVWIIKPPAPASTDAQGVSMASMDAAAADANAWTQQALF